MLAEQSSANTTSSPSKRCPVSTLPHCGRASASPVNATAASNNKFFRCRRPGLCEAVSSSTKCGEAIRSTVRAAP